VATNNDGPTGGTIQLRWKQPVDLERVILFNTTQEGRLISRSSQTDESLDRPLPPTGSSGVLSISLHGVNADELTIDLPAAGALAEIAYFWPGRIRADWELDHPLLSRLINNPITVALSKPEIQYSISLSLISCTITTILSLWVAVPIGYLLSRYRFFGRDFIDTVLDIPIVLPPLVVGLSLLILFQFTPSGLRELVVYQIPAVILAQFSVACAFAVRIMRATFDQIDPRCEQVALTLGCSRFSAFGHVVLPEAMRGMLTAGTLAWARALGEFGPLLIFAGATRNKTEVLSTTVFLELSVGDLSAAVAVSIVMVIAAVTVLILARLWGTRTLSI
jgi:molybdate transport system permease protein